MNDVVPDTSHVSPLIVSQTLSKFASEALYVIIAAPRRFAFADGAEIETVGTVLSTTTLRVTTATLPAPSNAVTVTVGVPSVVPVVAQCVYGVGPQTASKILAKMHDDEVTFYKDLFEAKLRYITTRPYWDERNRGGPATRTLYA